MLARPVLWVSRAGSLNDASEVQYALDLARQLLRQPATGVDATFAARVVACLDGNAQKPQWNVTIEPFVTSFCASIDGALQWLHYGRAGHGYAIGFDAHVLSAGRFALRRIIYDEDRQARLLAQVIRLFQDVLGPAASPQRLEAAAVACAAALKGLASRVKSPHFRGEDEWRLVTLAIDGAFVRPRPDADPEPTVQFRAVNDRVVPYVVAEFSRQSVRDVVLGHSVGDTDAAVKATLNRAGWTTARVHRSPVKVR
jgi:hypothetical protein